MNKAIFLDRDGTINVDKGYVHKEDDFILLPKAAEALKLLQEMGFLLVIVTNQSGIGRGYFSEEEYLKFQEYVDTMLNKQGIFIAAQYYCPHVDADKCTCRKPLIGMYEKAVHDLNIDWNGSYAIGDKMRDLAVCDLKPVKGFLISRENVECTGIVRVDSLFEAAKCIEKEVKR